MTNSPRAANTGVRTQNLTPPPANCSAPLRDDWRLALPRVRARQVWNSGSRARTVYEFTLVRGSQLMIMPVLSNPFIERYLMQNDIRVIADAAAVPVLAPS